MSANRPKASSSRDYENNIRNETLVESRLSEMRNLPNQYGSGTGSTTNIQRDDRYCFTSDALHRPLVDSSTGEPVAHLYKVFDKMVNDINSGVLSMTIEQVLDSLHIINITTRAIFISQKSRYSVHNLSQI